MKTKIYVNIAHYDDRGDPYPPNSYRPELEVGKYTFLLEDRGAHNGCMPIKEAAKIAKEIAKKLKVEVKHSWSVDTTIIEGVERYRIYKDGEELGYAIQISNEQWDLYVNNECEKCESLDDCFKKLKCEEKDV